MSNGWKRYEKLFLRVLMICWCWFLQHQHTCATAQQLIPQTGLHYYAIENLDSGQVVLRGTTGTAGVAFSNVILAPNTNYRVWILQAATFRIGTADFRTPRSGQRFTFPTIVLQPPTAPDSDADGLHDDGEFVLGTSPTGRDTDGDGILDGAEAQQGTDPLEGTPARTGIIGAVDTPGTALHLCAFNDIVAVANGAQGVSVFNVFNRMSPVSIAQVDTPGMAQAIACDGTLLAVADGEAGLAVIDLSDPPAARILHQLRLGSTAQTVVAAGGIAYVGLAAGQVVLVDLRSGLELQRFVAATRVHDLALAGDALYVLTDRQLLIYDAFPAEIRQRGSITVSGNPAPLEVGRKVFVGGNLAYVGFFTGYAVIDVSDPTQPQLLGTPPAPQNAVHDIAANGSGLVLATTSFSGTASLALSVYDGSDPTDVTRFITSFDTPGASRALTIYNGLAYVADSEAGVQVINYQAFDAQGIPPTIALSASFSLAPAEVEESSLVRLSADVSDDVQVRNVEFYLDGIKVTTDGDFPFEHRFVTPARRQQTSFTLQARASDTGGNSTLTEPLTVALRPSTTPPRVLRVSPALGAIQGMVQTITVTFSKPIDPATLTRETLPLAAAGPDGLVQTADDVPVTGVLAYREDINTASLSVTPDLPAGFYSAVVRPPLADGAGNVLVRAFVWAFRVLAMSDRDNDGIPDALEAALGLDPDNPDSDGNGILDGHEDFDHDGLANAAEIVLGTDPTVADSNGNGIVDGSEDSDRDGLPDGEELHHGTSPLVTDSDRDGWPDGAEVDAGSNPLSAASRPSQVFVATPAALLIVPSSATGGAEPLEASVTLAQPLVVLVVPSSDTSGQEPLARSVTLARPPVIIEFAP